MQDYSNSSANAPDLPQSCTKTLIWSLALKVLQLWVFAGCHSVCQACLGSYWSSHCHGILGFWKNKFEVGTQQKGPCIFEFCNGIHCCWPLEPRLWLHNVLIASNNVLYNQVICISHKRFVGQNNEIFYQYKLMFIAHCHCLHIKNL